MVLRAILIVVAIWGAFGSVATAQEQVWIQIEAHPNEGDALARAEVYAREIRPVEGYRLSTGWHAIVIGPLSPADATPTLRQLRITRQIPSDSYIVDGGSFRGQYWPPFGTRVAPVETAATEAPAEPEEPQPEPEPIDETPAEARRSEALLTREEKMELQSALAWERFYDSAIDGAIGRGSRNAMAAWQTDRGYDATGILTTRQRQELLSVYRGFLASIGMEMHYDDTAGIDIELPLAMVRHEGYEAPFSHFEAISDEGVDVILISQSGDRNTLTALFDVLQTLRIMPVDGPRSLRRNSFVIEGRNDQVVATAYAELTGDDVKGYILTWPVGDERRRELVWSRMQASFKPLAGQVIPDYLGNNANPDALAGLEIRRPIGSQTGFFVSDQGAILTSSAELGACSRITVGLDDVDTNVAASDAATGVALLSPADQVRPISVASFAGGTGSIGAEFALSAFSFGGKLGAPTLSFGTVEEMTGLSGEPHLRRLSLNATPGDAGAPVLDASGQVLGMLQSNSAGGRVLPEDVSFAVGSEHLRDFLGQNGVTAEGPGVQQSRPPEDLAALAANFTVLVKCWE